MGTEPTQVDAHFWFAPGVEVFGDRVLPSPPPCRYTVMVKQPLMPMWAASPSPENTVPMQTATFALVAWTPTSEVAHYGLSSQPPKGWRWIATAGTIHAEKI